MAKSTKRMSERDLAALVGGLIGDAIAFDSSDLAQRREMALRYFNGEVPDITAMDGRSSAVSRDVADVHGLIMPGLMRVFLAADNVAIYEPRRPEHEAFAKQATDYVNYVTLRESDGYRQFRAAVSDGLLFGNGILKHWWDPTPEYKVQSFTGLSDDAYTALVADDDVEEVLEHSEYPDTSVDAPMAAAAPALANPAVGMAPIPPEMGRSLAPANGMGGELPESPPAPLLHDVKIKRVCSYGRLRIKALLPEQFLIDRNAIVLDEQNVRFCGHRYKETRSTLIKQGYDRAQIDELPAAGSGAGTSEVEATARDDWQLSSDAAADRATELVDVYECFVLCDYDGDGVAEWRKVVMAGATGERSILENEEWGDDLPFSDIVPDPVPHRWRGRSLFDEVEDIQRVKTVLKRQLLDNTYFANNPRQIALTNQVDNPDALVNYKIGDVVFAKSQDAIRFEQVPSIAAHVFPVLEYMDAVTEKRTGISRASMALDMDALQNQTATATNAMQAAQHTKIEEYARNIAECGGFKRVFGCLLKLIVKHQDKPRAIRLRGEWVEMDPRGWDAEMDVTINTGLGSGSRDRDMAMLQGVLQKQELILQTLGPSNPLVTLEQYRNTLAKAIETAGLRSPELYVSEVTPESMQAFMASMANKPDPKAAEIQAKAQAEQQKMQAQAALDGQRLQMQAQLDAMALRFKQALETERAQREQQMQQMQLERQAAIEERQAQADIAVREREAAIEAALKRQEQAFDMRMQERDFAFKQWLETFKAENAARAQERRDMAAAQATSNDGAGA